MKIEQVKNEHKDEWVLVEVLNEDSFGKLIDVRLIAHSKRRDDTYKAMKEAKEKNLAHFYNGELPKDYAVAFYGSSSF